MNVPCEVIKDLLPLYHDDVCSAESRVLVEKHIAECDSCKETLGAISDEMERPVNAEDEAKPIKAIETVFKKSKAKSFIKGVLIAVLTCGLFAGVLVIFTSWKITTVSAEMIDVTDVYQLSDGRIAYRFNILDDKDLNTMYFITTESGEYHIIPRRSIIEGKRDPDLNLMNRYHTIDVEEMNDYYRKGDFDGLQITSIYIGPPGGGVKIWEEGAQLPPASEEMEKGLKRHYFPDGSGWLTEW
ncbi:MAG: zf-HC2 domain-containing protein [Oscillospiraceae bacterium]|nr:zf-HC2 domain-containing protein [Oscillospiraceae bacterium]